VYNLVMRATGIAANNLAATVERVSRGKFNGNVTLKSLSPIPATRRTTEGANFTLRVESSREAGARRSTSGRRLAAACWHAHRDVLRAIFDAAPNARIRSAFADYDGRDDFERSFPQTYHHNAGSVMMPASFGALCDCDPLDRF
jgi:hypothetical protein